MARTRGGCRRQRTYHVKRESVKSKLNRLEKVDDSNKKAKNFSNTFGKLLLSGAASDINVKVGDESFPAHKMILCMRSEVFTAMFGMPLTESATNTVTITDFRASTVKNLLKYMYTDEFDPELTMRQALDLIAIGDKYQIADIQEDCLSFMVRKVSSLSELEPFKEIAVVAREHGLSDIVDKALDRIIDLFPFAFDGYSNAIHVDDATAGKKDCTDWPSAKKHCVEASISQSSEDKSAVPPHLISSEHHSLFTSLGPELYFQLVERAVREAQEKRQNEVDEAEE